MAKRALHLVLNGEERADFIDSGATLLSVLRNKLHDFGPKAGCLQGTCGSCTVIVDGEPRLACITLAEDFQDCRIETVSGLSDRGNLHVLQREFLDGFASQCGFCTPGMLMAAKALLDINATPTRADVEEALSGNVCRCTGYEPIIQAVLSAASAAGRSE